MSDLLSAISIFLVFITFLLRIIDEEVSGVIIAVPPFKDQKNQIKSFVNRLYRLLFFKAIPINIIFLITAYSIFPKTIHLISDGKIDLWNFDPLATIFIFIECGVIGLSVYATVKTVQLILKIKSVNNLLRSV